jgi:hypothetical protein
MSDQDFPAGALRVVAARPAGRRAVAGGRHGSPPAAGAWE